MDESQSLEELRKQIIGIIDMDGFLTQKKNLCKELGIPEVGDVFLFKGSTTEQNKTKKKNNKSTTRLNQHHNTVVSPCKISQHNPAG